MKRVLTIVLAWASLVFMLSFVVAGSFKGEPVTEADALPAYEIVTAVRSMGLRLVDEPVRRGPYYVLRATDQRGTALRVVADAQFGDILSVAPTQNGAPQFQRGPRIIQVPQAATRENSQASVNRGEPDAADDDDDDDDHQAAPPPPRRQFSPAPQRQDNPAPQPRAPRWQPRSETPPPPTKPAEPRRAVLSAPPPPAEGPSPVRATPRFTAKTDPAGKFGAPRDANAPPLLGYTPPTALPGQD